MIDREKVIAAIESCLQTDVCKCDDCPYFGKGEDGLSCVGVLMRNARDLLVLDKHMMKLSKMGVSLP